MMAEMNYFDELKTSLEEAVAHRQGDHTRCRVQVRELPIPAYTAEGVARVRKELNLSQRGLAIALGVSSRTVEAWEAGKNEPSGIARRLLYLFECDHGLVDKLALR